MICRLHKSNFTLSCTLKNKVAPKFVFKINVQTYSQTNESKNTSFLNKLVGPQSSIASEGFKSRWLMVIPAMATHMCIGSPWAWSLIADTLTRQNGFVATSFSDWTLMQSAFPMSIVFLMLGVSASLVGKWQMAVGPRMAIATASLFFGSGMMVGAAGIHLHSLPLLYLGYGFMSGTGLGIAYTPPVQCLMQWFPDKKGIASGLTIAGFGSGALVFTPCAQYLMKYFSKLPEYLGPAKDFVTKTVDGKIFVDLNGVMVEVVNAGTAEIAKLPYALTEGLYVVGSGSSGAAETLAVMGGLYLSIMLGSALSIRNPHPSYSVGPLPTPINTAASTPMKDGAASTAVVTKVTDVSLEDAMKAPQFHLLGATFFCLATSGMGMFSVAKPMMSEVFSSALPTIATAAFATKFLLMLSSGNLGGRLGWAAVSDIIGRRATFTIFTMGSIPLYFALPTLVDRVVQSGSEYPMYLFCGSAALAISMMGGIYALLPAYEADLFGTKYVGAIHGRMLLYSSAAALAGPYMLIKLRGISEQQAIQNLLTMVNEEVFMNTFGVPITQAGELITAKTLTISKLLVLCPPGTIDPTPYLYDTTMYTLGGLMVASTIAHGMVRPIHATVINTTDESSTK